MALKRVENRLERIFERPFSRPFKNALQPIEIGARIIREIDLTRRLTNQGPISANAIRVWLGPDDADRFEGFQKALVTELEETVRQHALSEGYNFVGPVKVEVFIDDDLKLGNLAVKTEFVGGESQPRLIAGDGRSFNSATAPWSWGAALTSTSSSTTPTCRDVTRRSGARPKGWPCATCSRRTAPT